MKIASQEFFEFDLLQSDLIKSDSLDDEMTQIKSELSNMYWVYWKSRMIMNSWYKTKHPQPDSVDISQMSDAKVMGDVAHDLCYKDKVPLKTERFLDQKMYQLSKDYKDAKNADQLKFKINEFTKLIKQ